MQQIFDYILSFLLDTRLEAGWVGYTSDRTEWKKFKVVIIPSAFFKGEVYGTDKSYPQLPLKTIDDVPILFGEPSVSRTQNQIFVKADIVASTYFLISRYEELIVKERDENKRFAAKSSLLYKAGLLQTPIVDMYGRLLRKWLGECGVKVPAQCSKYSCVMTHDVDHLAQYRSIRGFAGGVLRGNGIAALKSMFLGVENDPLFSFDWMRKLENKAHSVKSKVFIKVSGNKLPQDIPFYNPDGQDVRKLLEKYNNDVGVHISYEAALNPKLIKEEVDKLSKIAGKPITMSRNHYLASLKPSDMRYLIDAGITDDYTLGYADMAGFRLGTARPVKWIDPERKILTNLTLHPLIVMDCTLNESKYMGLSMDDAFKMYKNLKFEVHKYGGEFVLLWHNDSVSTLSKTYHRELFEKILHNEEFADYM